MEELAGIIRNNYGLDVLNIEKIKNAYRIKTDQGFKCFKASKYDFRQFEFIINAITHLQGNGYKNIVTIYNTVDDDKYIEFNKGYGFLCDWVDSREVSFDNPVELGRCIEALARLHIASRGFNHKVNSSIRDLYGKWVLRFKKRCDELLYFKAILENKENYTEFDRIFLKYFEVHYRQGLKAIRDLESSNYFNIMKDHRRLAGFCHHDTANHNFLITSNLKVYLIDFDYCVFDSHLHDLGSIIIRNLKYGNWSLDKLEYILDLYKEYIPITNDELYVLFCFIEFPQDFWQIGLQYYVENQSWEEEVFLKRLNRTINDVKGRFEFLRSLEGGGLFDTNK